MNSKLAKLRNKKRLSQAELAKAVGVSASAISMYETGYRLPSMRIAKKLAKYFDVKIEDVL